MRILQLDPVEVEIQNSMRKLALLQDEGGGMRRDMELVRAILKAIQEREDLTHRELELEGYDALVVGRHVQMLYDAGYVEGIASQAISDPYKRVLITDLTWEGHEFAGAILTDEGVWARVKAALGPEKLATVPLKMIESLAMQALTAWGLKQMGLE